MNRLNLLLAFLHAATLLLAATLLGGCDSAPYSTPDEQSPGDGAAPPSALPHVYAFEEHEAVVEGVSSRRELTEEVGPAHPPLVVLDLNSNGQADVATGLSEQNVAYVFFDVTGFEKERYDVSSADVVIRGLCDGGACSTFGEPVGRGDINGDGYDDLIIGDRVGASGGGRVFVIFASESIPRGEVSISDVAGVEVSYDGERSYPESFGEAFTTGDLNADGHDDLIIGAPVSRTAGGGTGRGSVSVVYGGSELPRSIAAPAGADLVLRGRSEYDHLGMYLTAGDWNGDGYSDVAFSSFDDFSRSGTIWILYGQAGRHGGEATVGVDAEASETDGGRAPFPLSRIDAPEQGAEMIHLASGDLSGDGQDDLIMGAGRREAVYVDQGPIPPQTDAAAGVSERHVTIAAPERTAEGGVFSSSSFGRALFAYDTDSDGADELIIGAKGYTPPRPDPRDMRGVGGAFLFDLSPPRVAQSNSEPSPQAQYDRLLDSRFEGNNDGTRTTLPSVEFGRAVMALQLKSPGPVWVAVLDEVRGSSIYLFRLRGDLR